MSSLALTAPTEAKLDVFKIGSYIEWISELKFGNKGTLQSFSHAIGMAIKNNRLTDETITLLDGTKDQNWATPPKGPTVKEITIGQFLTSAGAPPRTKRSSSEKRRSIEEYNEKTYRFVEWIN